MDNLHEDEHDLYWQLLSKSSHPNYHKADVLNPRISTFYKISYKNNLQGKLKYGQHYYDFDEGGLFFVSPNQVVANYDDNNGDHSGYTLLIHPDFFLTGLRTLAQAVHFSARL